MISTDILYRVSKENLSCWWCKSTNSYGACMSSSTKKYYLIILNTFPSNFLLLFSNFVFFFGINDFSLTYNFMFYVHFLFFIISLSYSTVNILHFLAPLAVVSLCQIKKIAKCAFIRMNTWIKIKYHINSTLNSC